jgi:hypothetical protein
MLLLLWYFSTLLFKIAEMNIICSSASKHFSHFAKDGTTHNVSQTFIYGCHGGVALVVRRMVHIVLMVLFLTLWGEVHTMLTATENRIRI